MAESHKIPLLPLESIQLVEWKFFSQKYTQIFPAINQLSPWSRYQECIDTGDNKNGIDGTERRNTHVRKKSLFVHLTGLQYTKWPQKQLGEEVPEKIFLINTIFTAYFTRSPKITIAMQNGLGKSTKKRNAGTKTEKILPNGRRF